MQLRQLSSAAVANLAFIIFALFIGAESIQISHSDCSRVTGKYKTQCLDSLPCHNAYRDDDRFYGSTALRGTYLACVHSGNIFADINSQDASFILKYVCTV